MKIACVMMQKNENALLRPWVEYHAALCGIENLYVLDNGSTDQRCLGLLADFRERGLNVNFEHSARAAYAQREAIVTRIFHDLGATGQYDFIFPLDCDEFLAAHRADGSVSVEPSAIFDALEPFRGSPHVLTISGAYDNVSAHDELFVPSPGQRKCFFAGGQCKRLGLGYHVCEGISSSELVPTPVAYFHIHNRSHKHYRYAAFEKLAARVPDFSSTTLRAYAADRREGFHLISGFLTQEAAFDKRYSMKRAVSLPQFRERLTDLGTPLVFRDSDVPDVQAALDAVKGYSESAKLSNGKLAVRGWALVRGAEPAKYFKLLINRAEIEPSDFERVARPDVQKVHEGAPTDTGFELRVPAEVIPFGVLPGQLVSVHAFDPATGLFVPLVCRSELAIDASDGSPR